MLWVWLIPSILVLALLVTNGGALMYELTSGPNKHERCLQSIAELEPVVCPDLWPEWRWVEWPAEHAARWAAEHPQLGPTRHDMRRPTNSGTQIGPPSEADLARHGIEVTSAGNYIQMTTAAYTKAYVFAPEGALKTDKIGTVTEWR